MITKRVLCCEKEARTLTALYKLSSERNNDKLHRPPCPFRTKVPTPVELNGHQGSAMRSGLFRALLDDICMNQEAGGCACCPLIAAFPVAFVVGTLDLKGEQGKTFPFIPPSSRSWPDTAKPRSSVPPSMPVRCRSFPTSSWRRSDWSGGPRPPGPTGGRPLASGYPGHTGNLGKNPLPWERKPVIRSCDRMVQVLHIPITHIQIATVPVPLPELSLLFTYRGLVAATEGVAVIDKRLRWKGVWSYSTHRRSESSLSGLLGSLFLRSDDWTSFWPWLFWSQFTHVGKDAVKGNGRYWVEDPGFL